MSRNGVRRAHGSLSKAYPSYSRESRVSRPEALGVASSRVEPTSAIALSSLSLFPLLSLSLSLPLSLVPPRSPPRTDLLHALCFVRRRARAVPDDAPDKVFFFFLSLSLTRFFTAIARRQSSSRLVRKFRECFVDKQPRRARGRVRCAWFVRSFLSFFRARARGNRAIVRGAAASEHPVRFVFRDAWTRLSKRPSSAHLGASLPRGVRRDSPSDKPSIRSFSSNPGLP